MCFGNWWGWGFPSGAETRLGRCISKGQETELLSTKEMPCPKDLAGLHLLKALVQRDFASLVLLFWMAKWKTTGDVACHIDLVPGMLASKA